MRFSKYSVLLFASAVFSIFGEAAFAQKTETKNTVVVRQSVERVFNPAFKDKVEAELESVEHQLSDAFRSSDSVALNKLLSDTVLVHGMIGTKEQFIELLKRAETKYRSFEKTDMRIQMYGDTAVATGTLKINIDIENGGKFSQGVFFNTWKRVNGQWQCIALSN